MDRINKFNCPELTERQIKNLESSEIFTTFDLVFAPQEVVVGCIGNDDFNYTEFRKCVLRRIRCSPVPLASLIVNAVCLSTGIDSLDDMLRGGFHPGDLLQIHGPAASGKTQLCLYITAQISKSVKFTVIYFDMKNDFSSTRLQTMAHNEESLSSVLVMKPKNLEDLLFYLDQIQKEEEAGINPFYSNCKLIIIDSAAFTIYPAIQKDNGYSWRYHQERLLNKLKHLADQIGLSVILVNHSVRGWNLSGKPFKQLNWKAGLGQYWESALPIRIQLGKIPFKIKVDSFGEQVFTNFFGKIEKCTRNYVNNETFNFCIDKSNGKMFPICYKTTKWVQQAIKLPIK